MAHRFLKFLILLSCVLAVLIPSAALSQSDHLAVGLTGRWSFEENVASDSSGNGQNGTLVRNPVWTSGIVGHALQFNGTDNGNDDDDPQVVIGRNVDVPSLPFTIPDWVNPQDYNDWRGIFSKRDAADAFSMRLDIGLSQGTGQVYVFTGDFVRFRHAPGTGTWTHIAVVASASNTKLYFNGDLQETAGPITLGMSASANTAIGGTGEGVGGDNDPFTIIPLSANASDNDGAVVKVEFYANGFLIVEDLNGSDGMRGYAVSRTAVIENEAAEDARMAENFLHGEGLLSSLEDQPNFMYTPFFPLMIAGSMVLTRNSELADRLVSLVLGSPLVRPFTAEWISAGIPDPAAKLIYSAGASIEEKIERLSFDATRPAGTP